MSREKIGVIGATTCGLSKHSKLLRQLQPRVLLVEEAALSTEGTLAGAIMAIPSLSSLCLVGDHFQTAPQCDVKYLGDHPYNLTVSLFERLIGLGVRKVVLNQQRRMKPELRFIVQPFYPELDDHPSVLSDRPNVPGMGGMNCWWFDHSWPEEMRDLSRINPSEAEMLVLHYCYLISHGVAIKDITVLTFYNGQRREIRNKLYKYFPTQERKSFQVSTVDGFQGQENEIILLSLVRSPQPGTKYNVGFVDEMRRAVVAISRARRGFYIFGNLDNFLGANEESQKVWGNIFNQFSLQQRVRRNDGLPLFCEKHNDFKWVKAGQDFDDMCLHCKKICSSCVCSCDQKILEPTKPNIQPLVSLDGAEDPQVWEERTLSLEAFLQNKEREKGAEPTKLLEAEVARRSAASKGVASTTAASGARAIGLKGRREAWESKAQAIDAEISERRRLEVAQGAHRAVPQVIRETFRQTGLKDGRRARIVTERRLLNGEEADMLLERAVASLSVSEGSDTTAREDEDEDKDDDLISL